MLAFKNQVGEGSKFACASHLRSILPWVFYNYQLGILGQMRLVCVYVYVFLLYGKILAPGTDVFTLCLVPFACRSVCLAHPNL
jgi:hypothetical protein